MNFLSYIKKDEYKSFFFIILVFTVVFSIFALRPQINTDGDSFTYIKSMEIIKTGIVSPDFLPNRVVSTPLSMLSVIFLEKIFGNLQVAWLFLNCLLYIVAGMTFYCLIKEVIQDGKTAFFGSIFFITNYAMLFFGLNFLMDIGGWAFYLLSVYLSLLYFKGKGDKYIYLASLVIGLGGLFKEYAFFAFIVLLGVIVFSKWNDKLKLIKQLVITSLISFLPFVAVNIYSYITYHYTYISWLTNQPVYTYKSSILEYIKSFGILFNFGWFLFIGGLLILFRKTKNVFQDKSILFIWLIALSALPVFVWPIVVRVLFITIPAVLLITSLFIKEIKDKWYIMAPIIILYIIANYLMNSYVLNLVNIDKFLY